MPIKLVFSLFPLPGRARVKSHQLKLWSKKKDAKLDEENTARRATRQGIRFKFFSFLVCDLMKRKMAKREPSALDSLCVSQSESQEEATGAGVVVRNDMAHF